VGQKTGGELTEEGRNKIKLDDGKEKLLLGGKQPRKTPLGRVRV